MSRMPGEEAFHRKMPVNAETEASKKHKEKEDPQVLKLVDSLVSTQKSEEEEYHSEEKTFERLEPIQTEAIRENYDRTIAAEQEVADTFERNKKERLPAAMEELRASARVRNEENEWQKQAAHFREKAATAYKYDERMAAIRNAESFERLIAAKREITKEAVPHVETPLVADPERKPETAREQREALTQAVYSVEEAARIYQTGHTTEPLPAPEIQPEAAEAKQKVETPFTKPNIQEAAAIYQGSHAAVKTFEEARARAAERAAKIGSTAEFKAENARLTAEEEQRREYYFRALRRQERTRTGFFGKIGERLGLVASKGNGDFLGQTHALRNGWIEVRAERAKLMLASLNSDVHQSGVEGSDKPDAQELIRRIYEIHEVVFGAEEMEQRARIQALDSRSKDILERTVKRYAKLPSDKKTFLSKVGMAGATAVAAGEALLSPLAAFLMVMSGTTEGLHVAEAPAGARARNNVL